MDEQFGNQPTVPLQQASWIQEVCSRFQAAWESGQQPAITEFVADVQEPVLSALLERLILVDVACRDRHDTPLAKESYYNQFPHHKSVIDSVLASISRPDATQDTAAWLDGTEPVPAGGTDRPHPRSIGRFELRALLGEGSFGAVYRAYDPQLDREVALKFPRPGVIFGRDDRQRFMREARAAAQLRHPNIVPVHDAGEIDGTIYIESDFILGKSLRQVQSDNSVSQHQAVTWVSQIASALHYAHNKGIVHRDIKPENLLIDEASCPHVMDFGLARRDTGEELKTQEGTLMGTPAYMSPEQAKGESHLADARSDLWSLGIVLYELLTGERPFDGSGSTVLLRILEDTPTSPRQINQTIPPDLENICLKCLEKQPDARYASCQHLADDLQRFLRGEPVSARPIRWPERLVRACRRKPLVASLMAATAIALLLALVSMTVGFIRTSFALQRESIALGDKNAALVKLELEQAATLRAKGESDELRIEAEKQAAHLLTLRLADQAKTLWRSQPDRALLLAAEAADVSLRNELDAESLARDALSQLIVESSARPLLAGRSIGEAAVFDPEGNWLTMIDDTRRATTWQLEQAGDPDTPLVDGRHGALAATRLSPSGRWLALFSQSGLLRLYDLHHEQIYDLVVPDESEASAIRFITEQAIAFRHDEQMLAAAGLDKTVRLWRLNDDGPVANTPLKNHGNLVTKIAFSGVNGLLAGVDVVDELVLWDTADVATPSVVAKHSKYAKDIGQLEFSPDGKWLCTGADDHSLRLLDLQAPNDPTLQANLGAEIGEVGFSADGRWLIVVAGTDTFGTNRLQLWDLSQDAPLARPHLEEKVDGQCSMVLSPDRTRIASSLSEKRGIRTWSLDGDSPTDTAVDLPQVEYASRAIAISHSGTLIASLLDVPGPKHDQLAVWKLAANSATQTLSLSAFVKLSTHLSFSPDDRFLAGGGGGVLKAEAQIWRLDDGPAAKPNAVLPRYDHDFDWIDFTADGRWLIAAGTGRVDIFEPAVPADGQLEPTKQFPSDWISEVAYGPQGRWSAVARQDGTILLRQLDSTQVVSERVLAGHANAVRKVHFTADAHWLVSSGSDQTIRVWDLNSEPPAECAGVVSGRTGSFLKPVTSPDGRWLLAVGETIGLCDLAAPDPAATTQQLGTFGLTQFSDDSRWLTVATLRGICLFDLHPTGDEHADVPQYFQYLVDAADALQIRVASFIPDGSLLTEARFTADSRTLVLATEGGKLIIFSLDADGIRRLDEAATGSDRVGWVQLPAGSRKVITRSWREAPIRFWDLEELPLSSVEWELPDKAIPNQNLEISSDGNWLAAPAKSLNSGTRTVLLHHVATRNTLELSDDTSSVVHFTFSPDSKWLAVLRNDLQVRLHELDSARSQSRAIVLKAHFEPLGTYLPRTVTIKPLLAFSPDSRWLVTGDGRGVPVLHRLPSSRETLRDLVRYARTKAGRPLSAEERKVYLLE